MGRHISRVHARVDEKPDGLQVSDAESRNGIFVNGRKVESHILRPDDEIEIGEFILVFEPSFSYKDGIPEQRPRTVARVQEMLSDPFEELAGDKDLKSDSGRLSLIVNTIRLLHDIDEVKGAMKALLERILEHVPAKRGFVMISEKGGKLHPVAKHAPKDLDEFYVSNVLHHQVSREHRALIGTDLGKQGLFSGETLAILCAPMLHRDRYYGFVYLDGPNDSTSFAP